MLSTLKSMWFRMTRQRPEQKMPARPRRDLRRLVEQSMIAIAPHVPAECAPAIRKLLEQTPILVRVSRQRKSKHGDHRLARSRDYSLVSVNAGGNPWRFLLTLLHEIAHAHVAARSTRRVAPHGREWKRTFNELLESHLHLFPPDLRCEIASYAENPLYSSDAHAPVGLALRRYDTLDLRPTVQELALGQKFSLDGKTVLKKVRLLRTRFHCITDDGRVYHVSPTARVHTHHE
jgi:hypothetical protein